jgi:class 3 adenylate cyclase
VTRDRGDLYGTAAVEAARLCAAARGGQILVVDVVRTRRAWASMLLDRDAPGDRARAAELIAAGRAEAEQLGMAREIVRFGRLQERL